MPDWAFTLKVALTVWTGLERIGLACRHYLGQVGESRCLDRDLCTFVGSSSVLLAIVGLMGADRILSGEISCVGHRDNILLF